jgi:branched-chain amino acid transport system ATP-binding protein
LAEVRNKEIGFVFQTFNLLPRSTALDNVALPLIYAGANKKERDQRATKALENVGLGNRVTHKPNELSGGQRQQVAVGRALMTQPKVLMLDEPTAGVSPIVMDELFDRIIEIARTGIAILMVEQNARQALNIADKGYVLVQGANRYTDTGAALMANPDVRRTFLGG